MILSFLSKYPIIKDIEDEIEIEMLTRQKDGLKKKGIPSSSKLRCRYTFCRS